MTNKLDNFYDKTLATELQQRYMIYKEKLLSVRILKKADIHEKKPLPPIIKIACRMVYLSLRWANIT